MLQTLLQKRSKGYYYFRWACPPAIRKVLGKREIIKSLRTTSKIQALARAGEYYSLVDELLARGESRIKDGEQIFTAGVHKSVNGVVMEEFRNRVKAIQADINAYLALPYVKVILKHTKREGLDGVEDSETNGLDESELTGLAEAQCRFATIILTEHMPYLTLVLTREAKQYKPESLRDLQYSLQSTPKVLELYRNAKKNRKGGDCN